MERVKEEECERGKKTSRVSKARGISRKYLLRRSSGHGSSKGRDTSRWSPTLTDLLHEIEQKVR